MPMRFDADELTTIDVCDDGERTVVTPTQRAPSTVALALATQTAADTLVSPPGSHPALPRARQPPPLPQAPASIRDTTGSLVLTRISAFLSRRPLPGGKQPDDQAALAEILRHLREVPLASVIPQDELEAALQADELRYLSLGRDRLVETTGRTLLVLNGQLALGAFAPERLQVEQKSQNDELAGSSPKESRKPNASPLIRVTARAMTWFQPGDVVRLEALQALAVPPAEAPVLAVFSLTPAVVLAVSSRCLDAWAARISEVQREVARGMAAVNRRVQQNSGARGEIVNVYVRHGMSVATRLRVVDLDRCTFCRACETACAERHGAARLNIAGKVLGAWGFADTCRTCSDARCIEVCSDDAIHYDLAAREVLIDPIKCTGCSMCALACPYDAIQMHVLDQSPRLVERIQQRPSANPLRSLPTGPSKDRYRVADKCDHCIDFGGEQACITACTKHALLERTPLDVFFNRRHQDTLCRPAQPVYLPAERNPHDTELYDPITLMSEPARANQPKDIRLGWLWMLSLIWVLGICSEILLRFTAPSFSLWSLYLTVVQGMSDALAAACIRKRPYAPGSALALCLGITGTLLLIGAFGYSALVKRLLSRTWIHALMRTLESLSFHSWAGTLGLLLILLHSAGRAVSPHPLASLAFWLLVVTVLTGTAARMFASGILGLAAQAQLKAAHVTARLTYLRLHHAGLSQADRIYETFRRRYLNAVPKSVTTTMTAAGQRGEAPGRSPMAVAWRALGVLCLDEATRPLRALRLRRSFQAVADPKIRAEVARLVSQRALLKRHEVLLPALKPLFANLRLVHIPVAVLLSLAMLAHILMPHL